MPELGVVSLGVAQCWLAPNFYWLRYEFIYKVVRLNNSLTAKNFTKPCAGEMANFSSSEYLTPS